MAKNYGAGTSGYLDPSGRNWENPVFQMGKPVLDKELNLVEDLGSNDWGLLNTIQRVPSGWLAGDFLNSTSNFPVLATATAANQIAFAQDLYAIVGGWKIRISNTNANNANRLDLGAGPSGAGAKRTDLVILEVWRKLISAAPSTDGKSGAGRIWRFGNVKVASADDLTLNYADDILDTNVAVETTKRVQVQYRLRVV